VKTPNLAALLKRGDGKHSVGDSLSLTVRGGSRRWEYQFKDPTTGKIASAYWPAVGPAAISLSQAREERNKIWLQNREARRSGAPVARAARHGLCGGRWAHVP